MEERFRVLRYRRLSRRGRRLSRQAQAAVQRPLRRTAHSQYLSLLLAASVCCVFWIVCTDIAWSQADYAREKRWADEIVPAIVVGDALRLELAPDRTFLGIYAPAAAGAAGVILIHGA